MQGEIRIVPLVPGYLDVVRSYVAEELKSRFLAVRTRKNMEQGVVQFLLFIQQKLGVKRLGRVEKKHIEAFLAALEKRGYAAVTRQRKLKELRDFFAWLVQERFIVRNSAENVLPVKQTPNQLRVLSTEEYEQLMSSIDDARDYALIALFLHTGITLSEAHRLDVEDVLLPAPGSVAETGLLWATGRSKKRRLIYLGAKTCAAVSAWLGGRPVVATSALFVSQKEQRLSVRQMQYVVENYNEQSGLEGVNVKTLRATFAAHQLENDMPVEFLQKVMGFLLKRSVQLYVRGGGDEVAN